MGTLPARDGAIDLRAVTVRPTWGAEEHRRWDRLVASHHYLPFHGVFGKGLRHIALVGSTWLALIGWQPGAFKLAARDRWLAWSAEQQCRRLHLIANNVRFVILTPRPVPNLASRVLGLSLRRLSRDMQAVHGYPIFLAETFVDPARFAGTCYRASNWRSLGLTRGFAREPGGSARWRHHGQPKEIFVFELTANAAEVLSQAETPAQWHGETRTEPMAALRLRSLFECLGEVPQCRLARGKRYPLNTVLALAVAARLAGYRGVTAFAQFARLLSQESLKAVGGHCQTNWMGPVETNDRGLSGCKLTPLGQGGGALEFEVLAVVKMTFPVEMIVDRGVGGGKLLQGFDVPEPGHRSPLVGGTVGVNFRLDC